MSELFKQSEFIKYVANKSKKANGEEQQLRDIKHHQIRCFQHPAKTTEHRQTSYQTHTQPDAYPREVG